MLIKYVNMHNLFPKIIEKSVEADSKKHYVYKSHVSLWDSHNRLQRIVNSKSVTPSA